MRFLCLINNGESVNIQGLRFMLDFFFLPALPSILGLLSNGWIGIS